MLTTEDQIALGIRLELTKPLDVLEPIAVEGGFRFDFNRDERLSLVNDQIDFVTMLIAPEIQCWGQALVDNDFHTLRDHEVLKNTGSQRVRKQLIDVANAQKLTDQTRIVEVKLRRLDEALSKIHDIWCESKRDEA